MNKTTIHTIEFLPQSNENFDLDSLRAIVRDTADLPGGTSVQGRSDGGGSVPPVLMNLVGINLTQHDSGTLEKRPPASDAPKCEDVNPYDGKVFCPEHVYEYRVRQAEAAVSFPRYGRIKAVALNGRRPLVAALDAIRDHFGLASGIAIQVRRDIDAGETLE
ncbi:hypothetical protein SEA_REYNAULD_82 [Rhodococcus phage Reynauld]|uniref:Uncharacterized protein n=1 Tax=Rhodococcus phage Reynauld TaxID=3062845 RepID=A0ACD4UHN6_9CAUD|nr:hypothetical protein SEA_REYNAULD_82 [Rhodococcus phage Reynauld]